MRAFENRNILPKHIICWVLLIKCTSLYEISIHVSIFNIIMVWVCNMYLTLEQFLYSCFFLRLFKMKKHLVFPWCIATKRKMQLPSQAISHHLILCKLSVMKLHWPKELVSEQRGRGMARSHRSFLEAHVRSRLLCLCRIKWAQSWLLPHESKDVCQEKVLLWDPREVLRIFRCYHNNVNEWGIRKPV